MIKPLEPKIKKKWDVFLEFLYTEKHLAHHCWKPCESSILLWEEFKEWSKKSSIKH